MRYYTIFGSLNEYLRASYKDISKVEGAVYQAGFLPGKPTLVRKIHTAHCLMPKKALPGRSMWYKHYFKTKYQEGDEHVFVFFYPWHPIYENGYLDYLRKTYPGCKCVLFLCDIACARKLDMEKQKKLFDHVMVFERNFAREHGIAHYPLVYSDFRHEVKPEDKDIDLLFVGWAKGRYKLLKEIYDRLASEGVNCQFYLTKPDEEVPPESGIHTADWVPYPQYIALMKRAKCVLDIIPPNTDCSTLRMSESMAYSCKVLTNNTRIVYEDFYDPESISAYASPEEIDVEFVKKEYVLPERDEHVKKMGPRALIQYLDNILFEKGV